MYSENLKSVKQNSVFFKSQKVTHSSGNHGQALAWASNMVGLDCTVVVTKNTPKSKCEAIKAYGADLVFCEPTYADR